MLPLCQSFLPVIHLLPFLKWLGVDPHWWSLHLLSLLLPLKCKIWSCHQIRDLIRPLGILMSSQLKGLGVGIICGFREYAYVKWTKAKKQRSRHLVLWSQNHEYSTLTWKDRSYHKSTSSKFRSEDGKVLGNQPHLTHGSTSSHCVL